MIISVVSLTIFLISCALLLRAWFNSKRVPNSIAFLHPRCSDMGGGERVLWCLVKQLLEHPNQYGIKNVTIFYDAFGPLPKVFLENLKKQLGIDLDSYVSVTHAAKPAAYGDSSESSLRSSSSSRESLSFIPIKSAFLLSPTYYPTFTILLQSIGGMFVCLEALIRFTPCVLAETCSFIFSSIVSRATGTQFICYVHYPLISSDMVKVVRDRRNCFNNKVGYSVCLTYVKIFYYTLFGYFYRIAGGLCNKLVVNSTWTYSHISKLMAVEDDSVSEYQKSRGGGGLRKPLLNFNIFNDVLFFSSSRLALVYPPCDLEAFVKAAKPWAARSNRIISVAQFRPEKNHKLQLEAFSLLIRQHETLLPQDLELVVCGSVRNNKDQKLVDSLIAYAAELRLSDRVTFKVNIPYSDLHNLLGSSKVALHTMENEHFGIAVVECLAAGTVVVSHNSGGPAFDILHSEPLLESDQYMEERTVEDGLVMLHTPKSEISPSCTRAAFGYLCTTADGFAAALSECFMAEKREEIACLLKGAKSSLKRFNNNEEFAVKCLDAMQIKQLMHHSLSVQ